MVQYIILYLPKHTIAIIALIHIFENTLKPHVQKLYNCEAWNVTNKSWVKSPTIHNNMYDTGQGPKYFLAALRFRSHHKREKVKK